MRFFQRQGKESMKKMDKIVTGLILGGVLASLYGLKKYEDTKTDSPEVALQPPVKKTFLEKIRSILE